MTMILLSRTLPLLALFMTFTLSANAQPLLNGVAQYEELQQPLFYAGYYSDSPGTDIGTQLALSGGRAMEVRVAARRLSARKLNSIWLQSIAVNAPSDLLSEYADDITGFTKLLRYSLKTGDQLRIEDLGDSTLVSLNGITLGSIESDQLFNLVLRCWLGSVPPSTDFQQNIMANGAISDDLLSSYSALSASPARIAALQEKMTAPKENPAKVAATPAAPKPKLTPDIGKPTVAIANRPAPTVQQPQLEASPPEDSAESAEAIAETAPEASATEKSVASETKEPAESQTTEVSPEAVAESGNPQEEEEEIIEEEAEDESVSAAALLARQEYFNKLIRKVYSNIRYPDRAVQRGQEGSLRFTLSIGRDGVLADLVTDSDTKYSLLNKAAAKAIAKSEPFPPIPDAIPGEVFSVSLPIVFRIPK